MLAVTNARYDVVQFLMSQNINLNVKGSRHCLTALQLALREDLMKGVKILIEAGAAYTPGQESRCLYKAIMSGDLELVKLLVTKNSSLVDRSDKEGRTPLLLSASCGHNTLVGYFVSQNANVNAEWKSQGRTEHGKTVLHWAHECCDRATVVLLIQAGANDTALQGEYLIHKAAKTGDFELLKLLVETNPELLNQTDDWGQSPLVLAIIQQKSMFGSFFTVDMVVQYFITQGADLNLATNKPGSTFHLKTALHWAWECCPRRTVIQLVQAGARDTAYDGEHLVHKVSKSGDLELLKLLIEKTPSLLNQTSQKGKTPLMLAACNGRTELVRYLVSQKADTHLETPPDLAGKRKTALQLAHERGHSAVVIILMGRSNAPENDAVTHNRKIKLLTAVLANDLAETKTIASLYPDLACSPLNDYGSSAVHIAAEKGYEDILRFFGDLNSNLLHQQDSFGRTPLMLVAAYGHTSYFQSWTGRGHLGMARYLMDKGCNLNISITRADHAEDGKTALHWAYERRTEYPEMPEILVQGGAVDTPYRGEYIIHKATRDNCLDMVCLLTEKFPWLVNQVDSDGQTPADIAADHDHDEMIQYLASKGARATPGARNKQVHCAVDDSSIPGNTYQMTLFHRTPAPERLKRVRGTAALRKELPYSQTQSFKV